jgi:TfoX/Sxy family transcriptional regulator of competence genes
MTSDSQIQYFAEQLSGAGTIRYRKMFGEYGLYLDEKFFALACDNKLFFKVKGWPAGEVMEIFGNHNAAYPGAANTAQVFPEILEDKEKITKIAKLVVSRLAPKTKPKPTGR